MKKILIITLICTLIDQLIKYFIVGSLTFEKSIVVISDFFNITLLKNTGAAFNILNSNTILLVLISIVALGFFYYFFIKGTVLNKSKIIIYGVLLGGIIGNLIDRIFRGYVVDYLDFKLFGYNFPVFNFADTCIVVSIFLIIYMLYKDGKNEAQS